MGYVGPPQRWHAPLCTLNIHDTHLPTDSHKLGLAMNYTWHIGIPTIRDNPLQQTHHYSRRDVPLLGSQWGPQIGRSCLSYTSTTWTWTYPRMQSGHDIIYHWPKWDITPAQGPWKIEKWQVIPSLGTNPTWDIVVDSKETSVGLFFPLLAQMQTETPILTSPNLAQGSYSSLTANVFIKTKVMTL